MGINARSSLHPRWTTHEVPVVRGFMLATVRVIRKSPNSEPVYNQATGQWTGDFITVVSSAKARVQPYGIIGDTTVAQDPTGRRLMRVQIESKETGIQLDDMLEIIDSPEDPELTLYTLEVRGSIGSSNSWVTDLVCEANLKAYVAPEPFGEGGYSKGIYGGDDDA